MTEIIKLIELGELVKQNKTLNGKLRETEDNSIKMIEKSLTEKFMLLSKILDPYKNIMIEMDMSSKVIVIRSEELKRNIKIKINTKEKFWLQVSFNSDIYYYLMPSHLEQTYWVKYPVLQEINIEKVVSEFERSIIFEIKTKNENIAARIKQIEKALKLCSIETGKKIFEEMLNELFKLNNEYITSKNKALILQISNLITAIENLNLKEE